MRRWLSILGLIVISGCKFECTTGGGSIEKLEALIEGEIGVRPEVTCPELVLNKPVQCTATLPDGTVFDFTATATAKEISFKAPDWAPAKSLTKDITSILKDKHKLDPAIVNCPPMVHVPVDGKGMCTAIVRDVKIPIEITQRDGRYFYTPKSGLVVGELAAKAVNDELASKNIAAKVECPFLTRLSKPGDRFGCPLTFADGKRALVHYVITSENGTIDFSTDGPPPYQLEQKQ